MRVRRWLLTVVAFYAIAFVAAKSLSSAVNAQVLLSWSSTAGFNDLYDRALASRVWHLLFDAPAASMPQADVLQLFIEENRWKNSFICWVLPDSLRAAAHPFLLSWFRNYIGCVLVYFVTGGLWAYYCYYCLGDLLYPPGTIPSPKACLEQIQVTCWAMPLYSLLPAITEFMVERGWTCAYARIDQVGLAWYVLYFYLYMTCVEFGVYWMHRLLHDIKIGYRLLHNIHHIYNKEHTLSPFAGLAFHPLDGILQAVPYTAFLFFCPMHFLTHELLLFATGVWTTNIHDNVHGNTKPIMGAGYHTIHHTTYKHNYGHYFIYMDWLFGTLVDPEEFAALEAAQKLD